MVPTWKRYSIVNRDQTKSSIASTTRMERVHQGSGNSHAMESENQERVIVRNVEDLDSFLRLLNPHQSRTERESEIAKPIWSRRKAYTFIAVASLIVWAAIIGAGLYVIRLFESL